MCAGCPTLLSRARWGVKLSSWGCAAGCPVQLSRARVEVSDCRAEDDSVMHESRAGALCPRAWGVTLLRSAALSIGRQRQIESAPMRALDCGAVALAPFLYAGKTGETR